MELSMRNRLANVHNYFQGESKRILCVCSAGLLRSPTAAFVLSSEPFNFNTRAAGITSEYALIPVDQVLIEWADEIVCMEETHAVGVKSLLQEFSKSAPIITLNIQDMYGYRDPSLVELISSRYKELGPQDGTD